MTLAEKQNELGQLFESLGSWSERFQYLFDLSQEDRSNDCPEQMKTPTNLVSACISRTYFVASAADGVVSVHGWSNASIPAGLILVLIDLFDGCSLTDLRSSDIHFHTSTGLLYQMTAQRQTSLLEMIHRLRSL